MIDASTGEQSKIASSDIHTQLMRDKHHSSFDVLGPIVVVALLSLAGSNFVDMMDGGHR